MKKIIAILCTCVLCFNLCSCKSQKLVSDEISKITIQLSGSYQTKVIDKEEDVERILKHINAIDTKEKEIGNLKGWSIRLQMYDADDVKQKEIVFLDHLLSVDSGGSNRKWYLVDESEVERMEELYHDLDYPLVDLETEWGYTESQEDDSDKKIKINELVKITILVHTSGTTNRVKEIDQKKDIKTVINYVNDIQKEKASYYSSNDEEILIRIHDKDGLEIVAATISPPWMQVYGENYRIADDEFEKFMELYDMLDYPESDWW